MKIMIEQDPLTGLDNHILVCEVCGSGVVMGEPNAENSLIAKHTNCTKINPQLAPQLEGLPVYDATKNMELMP